MTKASPEIEALAQQRLASDESAITGSRRTKMSLGQAWAAFWRHPSPWMILATVLGAAVARGFVHRFSWTELIVPVLFVAFFPVTEWVVHVVVLHWRPVRLGPVRIDPLVSRKHRAHHADPRDIPLVFIPWQVLIWLLVGTVAIGLLAFPDRAAGFTFMIGIALVGFGYEWAHYLIHSDYRPKGRLYKAVWRNHRLHHYKNEHYWFTVTTTATADRLFGTYPDPATVKTSATAKNLHGAR
ncbi:sterol desaturase family protein [Nocardioides pocheonensis]|uniref:Fatty acid hydroxylase family protein n=1 Tax=Nocardioides pocheonensis TaxID=661485 RepID=A0A3N0GNU2_9ACTN|nr:sterol desaturase family protein [Nocardioides pocheonensis]RNM14097.1 fatty acid hydroxylase family protein [Nocardioides pocheonensis]